MKRDESVERLAPKSVESTFANPWTRMARRRSPTALWNTRFYFSATKIQWILNNVAGARKRAEAGDLAFGTMDSWLIWNLTGGKVHVTDPSNASRTMLYNIHTGKWDKQLLGIFDVPASMLPSVETSSGGYAVQPQRHGG